MGKPFYQVLLPALTLLTALIGCGGNGKSASVARDASMDYSVEWPSRSRALPVTANSAVVSVAYKGQTIDSFVFERPDATAPSLDHHVFQNLPAADLTVTVTAFPEAHGAGNAVAAGVAPITLRKGEVAQQAATMASTASKLELSALLPGVVKGMAAPLTLTAKDAKDRIVPLRVDTNEEAVTWGSDDETVATAEGGAQYGKFHGVAVGATKVWAKFGSLQASLDVAVTAPRTTSVKFTMPWQFNGVAAPEGWRQIKVTAMDGSDNIVSKTIDRSIDGSPVTVMLDGVLPGSVALSYQVIGYQTSRGYDTLFDDSANVTATNDAVDEYTFAAGPFHAVPLKLGIAPQGPHNDTTMYIFQNGAGGIKATAAFTDGTLKDVTSDASWTSRDTTVAIVQAPGQIASAPSAMFGATTTIKVVYKGLAASQSVFVDDI